MSDYEVYIGSYQGEVKYVGEGKKGRHRHLNSGVSALYEANEFHFQGKTLEIKVRPMSSKDRAKEVEAELIFKLAPEWNTRHHPDHDWKDKMATLRCVSRLEKAGIISDAESRILKFFVKKADKGGLSSVSERQLLAGLGDIIEHPGELSTGYPNIQRFLSVEDTGNGQCKVSLHLDGADYGLKFEPVKRKRGYKKKTAAEIKEEKRLLLAPIRERFRGKWGNNRARIDKHEAKEIVSELVGKSKVSAYMRLSKPFTLHGLVKFKWLSVDEYMIELLED